MAIKLYVNLNLRAKKNIFACAFLVTLFSCSIKEDRLIVSVNTFKKYQTIEGFGASDAWRCQFIGKNWPNQKKENIAKLLFSKNLDENSNPEGIGLSMWRFYIGAGTTEQGDSSNIKNEWRRAESFINKEGKYDWSKQEGQQWFLEKAKNYNVEKFLAFSIAAPVQWSLNGKGYNDDVVSGNINLQNDKFDHYAKFMVDVVKHFKEEKNITFDYLSPINEPQWNWETKTQEGTPANNNDILNLSKKLSNYISDYELDTDIVIAESADLRWLYSDFGKPKRGNQIDYFFNKKNQIENLKPAISGHSYFTTWPLDSLIKIRQELKNKLNQYPNLNFWQSEFCILEKNDDITGGHSRDLGINTALYVARVMHADLTIANATSWQWWTSISNADYKDGLIYIDTGNKEDLFNLNKLKFDGVYHESKLLWAFGNFSRFVRPDMIRVDVTTNSKKTLKENYKDIMFSAYLNPKTNELVIVAINYKNEDQKINFQNLKIDKMYVTSTDKNLQKVEVNKDDLIIESKSVTTLIAKNI